MRFSINQSELQNALGIVMKAVSSRATLPVLAGVLLEASGDYLSFQTTDLTLSIQYKAPALVEEEGRAVVPAKLFFEIVKNLPDAAVQVQADNEQAVIICDTSSFSIRTLDPEDFPGFPQVVTSQKIDIPFAQFSSMVKRVAKVVSKDETRAILTGVLVSLADGTLSMVATDSYRLSLVKAELPATEADEFQAVIAGNFLQEIASLPKVDAPISLALAENQIVVTCQNVVFINRRLEGTFPRYQGLIPESYTTRVIVDASALSAAVRRTSLLVSSTSPVRLDIDAATQTLHLSANSQDVGSAQETIRCQVEGEDMSIAFNYAYLQEGLGYVSSQNAVMELRASTNPGIFKSDDDDQFLYLVMPVRLS